MDLLIQKETKKMSLLTYQGIPKKIATHFGSILEKTSTCNFDNKENSHLNIDISNNDFKFFRTGQRGDYETDKLYIYNTNDLLNDNSKNISLKKLQRCLLVRLSRFRNHIIFFTQASNNNVTDQGIKKLDLNCNSE